MNKSILFGRLVKDPIFVTPRPNPENWQLPTSGLR